jgi:hypothetical protein
MMLKILTMWFTLCASLVIFLGGVPIIVVRQLPENVLNKTMSLSEVILSCLIGLPVIALLVYGAVCTWLIFWRPFARQKEIFQILGAGPITKWDVWLTRTLGPQK